MLQPVTRGRALIEEIDRTITATPTLWWLGHSGFLVRFATITFYVDPCLSDPPGRKRLIAAPLAAPDIRHADMLFATHAHPGHLDAATAIPLLEASKRAKLALPKSAAEAAHAAGIPYHRMTTTDADLRVEYFKDDLYSRVYAIPSAHPQLDRTPGGGYPYLGYLFRFGRWTIYHAGDCTIYDGLADRLRPFNVDVALLPIGEDGNFSVAEAARLASEIGAGWIVPMHYGTFSGSSPEVGAPILREGASAESKECKASSGFIAHMLGHRPEQRFKVFQCGEKWTVPED